MRQPRQKNFNLSPISDGPNFKAISISDIHLGHPRTDTAHMLIGIRNGLMTDEIFTSLDLLILAGDVFDRELRVPQVEVELIREWIVDLLLLCQKHDVILRVLEGTPSHDWRQSKMFIEINELLGSPCNVRHLTDVCVEVLEKSGLSILYVPDEYRETCAETQVVVEQTLLNEFGIAAVDIAIMHGSFNYQYPKHQRGRIDCHDDEYYSSLARYFITVGHVHRRGNYKNIWSQGSWDCIAHGEPDPKGGIMIDIWLGRPDKTRVSWLVNPNAKVYVSVNVENVDADMAVAIIHDKARKLGYGANIRVVAQKDHPALTLIQQLRQQYPQLIWSAKRTDSKVETQKALTLPSEQKRSYRTVIASNIRDVVRSRISPDTDADLLMEILEECLND